VYTDLQAVISRIAEKVGLIKVQAQCRIIETGFLRQIDFNTQGISPGKHPLADAAPVIRSNRSPAGEVHIAVLGIDYVIRAELRPGSRNVRQGKRWRLFIHAKLLRLKWQAAFVPTGARIPGL